MSVEQFGFLVDEGDVWKPLKFVRTAEDSITVGAAMSVSAGEVMSVDAADEAAASHADARTKSSIKLAPLEEYMQRKADQAARQVNVRPDTTTARAYDRRPRHTYT